MGAFLVHLRSVLLVHIHFFFVFSTVYFVFCFVFFFFKNTSIKLPCQSGLARPVLAAVATSWDTTALWWPLYALSSN